MNKNMQPSVCIDAVFNEYSVTKAVEAVKATGIPAFEFWGWWDKDLDEVIDARDASGLKIAACCTKFVSLVDAEKRNDYLSGLVESMSAAHRLGTSTLISQVGDARDQIDRRSQHQCLVDGLREAAPLLESAKITLVIEPLNVQVDHPGYFLTRSEEAFEVVDEVNSPNVKVIFDIYHQQVSEGHLIHNITNNIEKIGHFHAAGNPGRHELTRGEIHYPSVIKAIRASGYEGYVGMEYWPVDAPEIGLRTVADWFPS